MKYTPMVIDPDYQYFNYKDTTLYELIEKRISSKQREPKLMLFSTVPDMEWLAYNAMMRRIIARTSDGLVVTDTKILEAIRGEKDDWELFKEDIEKRHANINKDIEYFAKW